MHPRSGPSLPQSLLEELDPASGKSHGRKGAYQKLSRKEARKQERGQKKQRKAEFFTGGRQNTKRHIEDEHIDSPDRKRARISEGKESIAPQLESKSKQTSAKRKPAEKSKDTGPVHKKGGAAKSETALEKLVQRTKRNAPSVVAPPKASRTEQEKKEDAYIAYLESKLGWAKSGSRTSKYGQGLDDDGLDDLLKDVESIEASIFSSAKQQVPNDEDDWDENGDSLEEEEDDDDDDDGDEEEEEEDEEEEDGDESVHSEDTIFEENMAGGDEDTVPDDGEHEWTGFDDIDEHSINSGAAPPAPTEANTASSTRYIPPHLRKTEGEPQSEAQIKLTRQLKGLFNRMSEQNISSIVDGVEEIYRKERRHDVTSTITKLFIDSISSHSMLLDSYVVLHAAFISSLHKIIGVEFAASFVQNVVASYERHFSELQGSDTTKSIPSGAANDETTGKECSNLIILLSELYNFQVISCLLIYDLIRGLLDGELTEFKVELLLKIVRNSGQQLRSDDPSALKDIIQAVHSKLPTQQNAMSSRTRFMVETLTNLKNNKSKKNAPVPGADAVDRMKKFLSGLSKRRNVLAHEPLRISLADLHSAETKGKWWLVGAAWGGDPLIDRKDEIQQHTAAKKAESTENILLKLAKKQGMNTDIRRSIFVVLMSSEDYVDACERLSQLKLTEVQQREIIRVILHCCGNEKSYNPYYAFVAQQLCRTSHSYKITLQFCLWDFLRDMGETAVGGAEILKNMKDDVTGFDIGMISNSRSRNVARAYAWWIAKDCCTLAIFKPVDFTNLKPQTTQFFTELFTHLFADVQLPTPLLTSDPKDLPSTRNRGPLEEVFIKATRIETLALGLVYFLSQIFGQGKEQDGGSGFIKWAMKVATETLRTGVGIVAAI